MMNEDRLSLAQMERLRAELRPNLVFVLGLVRRELDELRVDHELIRRELEDIQALLHDATQRNAAGRLWWFAVALVVAFCGACHAAAQRRPWWRRLGQPTISIEQFRLLGRARARSSRHGPAELA